MRLPTDKEFRKYVEGLLNNEEFMALAYKLGILKRRKK